MNTASVRGKVRGMKMLWACSTVVRMTDCMRGWDEVGLARALEVEGEEAGAVEVAEVVVAAAEEEEEEEGEEACSRRVHKMAGTFVSEDIPWA